MGRRPRRPDNADITVTAKVRARQLRFGEVPRSSTEFTGAPGHESASGSDRANLPERVEKDISYRDVQVDYWLAAALRYPAEPATQSVAAPEERGITEAKVASCSRPGRDGS